MSEPIAIYKSPGPHPGPDGKTYDCAGVAPEMLDAKLAEGWSTDFHAALYNGEAKKEVDSDEPDEQDDEQPDEYRAELLKIAREIGMKPRKIWTDDELKQKIDDKLEGKV